MPYRPTFPTTRNLLSVSLSLTGFPGMCTATGGQSPGPGTLGVAPCQRDVGSVGAQHLLWQSHQSAPRPIHGSCTCEQMKDTTNGDVKKRDQQESEPDDVNKHSRAEISEVNIHPNGRRLENFSASSVLPRPHVEGRLLDTWIVKGQEMFTSFL